ncbi:MurR/RpiR family transcriptional regulator [Mixta intestinalis]|uniref:HTH-type transcriptional regulator HexR n=1 Tax=Mixta intestinalis TaxID=1615494 RepID=A0A6P1Q5P1_9GAMM|nr:MurR/RpiR family transcriptional regulator [Mixta intestinalis]QHM73722.1 HTH-type transcriptional regulator HexR [Mixta intestinalis]
MDLVWQLENSLQRLPQQQSRIARFVLENLQFSCSATLEQLAQQAGVSADTLSAFARSVGCRDMDDFMQQLRTLQQNSAETHRVQPAITGDVDYASTSSLEKLAAGAGVSPETVKRFARSIGREDFDDILFQIGKRLNELSQQEARVARTVLANVSFAASATIDQLASHAGVSPATITRFAKSVGCEDIRELRMKLAQASASHSRYMAPGGAAPLSAGERRLAEVQQALHQQLQQNSSSSYAEAAQLLHQARSVTIFTAGGSEAIYGLQVQQQLMAQGVTTTLSQEPHFIGVSAAMLNEDQALMIISLGEPDVNLRNAALLARSRHVPVVMLAAVGHPLADLADILLALPEDPLLARYGLLITLDLLRS